MPPFVSIGLSVPPENARIFTAQAVLFMINVRIIRKKQEKIWWNKIKAVPLQSLLKSKGGYQSGQMGQTVNLLAMPSVVRIHHYPLSLISGNSSVDRALAFQAGGRGFESRFPLSE